MAEDVKVRSDKQCILDQNGCVTLKDILIAFNAPINEEHAWALCYQCSKCFKNAMRNERERCLLVSELDHVLLHRDGQVHPNTIFAGGGTQGALRVPLTSETKILFSLGVIIWRALDYGLQEFEEKNLSPDLDRLIDLMTSAEDDSPSIHQETDDEGIERDSGENDEDSSTTTHLASFDVVIKYCMERLGKPTSQQADAHYRAVVRALVAEALELSTFLEKVSQGTNDLRSKTDTNSKELDQLQFSDWARLWVQVIRELRNGVKLKKVDYNRTPIEFELTPYEILMDDIRSRRYKLNKVMVDGDIPHKVKKDAHAIILEFIRSRPPLKKASERKLRPVVSRPSTPREMLMDSIKQGPRLRPSLSPAKTKVGGNRNIISGAPSDVAKPYPVHFVREEKAAEVMEELCYHPTVDGPVINKNNSSDGSQSQRRLIHVDFSKLQSDDEDEEDILKSTTEDNDKSEKRKRTGENPYMRTGTLTQDEYHHYCDQALESYDLATQCPSRRASARRHTIVVCEAPERGTTSVPQSRPLSRQSGVTTTATPSPGSEELANLASTLPEMSWSRTSLQEDLFQSKTWAQECLSLTLEEIVHIRSVLTKAELESLPVDGHVKGDVEKRKVCFLCLKTRFSIFGPWGQKCRLCKRTVCAKCFTKMRIPTEHFAHVPVVALSPSLLNSPTDEDSDGFSRSLVPHLLNREPRNSVGSAPSSPRLARQGSASAPGSRVESSLGDGPQSLPAGSPASTVSEKSIRGRMARTRTLGRPDPTAEKLKGLEMTVCHDCKAMVIQIIKSSRTNRTNAIRNLTLNLSPVY